MRKAAALPPYIPLLVSEISSVESLSTWNNKCVRVLGRLHRYAIENASAELVSVDEPGNFTIRIKLDLLNNRNLSNGNIYLIYGELDIEEGSPVILAQFMFECNTINTQMFYKANDLIWKRFSHVLR